MDDMSLVLQAGYLKRAWPKKGIHEGAVARVICSEKHPVYFVYWVTNGVLKIKFMREARAETGELLLPVSTCIINIDVQVDGAPVVPAGFDSESDGYLAR